MQGIVCILGQMTIFAFKMRSLYFVLAFQLISLWEDEAVLKRTGFCVVLKRTGVFRWWGWPWSLVSSCGWWTSLVWLTSLLLFFGVLAGGPSFSFLTHSGLIHFNGFLSTSSSLPYSPPLNKV